MTVNEYILPPISEMLSPAELEALINESSNNEELDVLLKAWSRPAKRAEMNYRSLEFIAEQIWFQIQDENTVRFAIYGGPGKGKSMIAQFLAFFSIDVYQEHGIDITKWPLVARSPSDANDTFSKETKKGNTVCLILDEKEKQSGTASKTNLISLVQNLDTMRVLMHSLIMIAITKQELGNLISRCQIVFHAIFKDKKNRVNWCIMYVNDMEAKTLIPLSIVGIPIHKHQWFIDWYEKDKMSRQIKLTSDYGRSQDDPQKVIDAADKAVAYLKEKKLKAKSGTIKDILKGVYQFKFIGEEESWTISRVQRILEEEKPHREPDEEIFWVGDKFDWKMQVSSILKDDIKFPKNYRKIWNFMEVDGLKPFKHKKNLKKMAGLSYFEFMKHKRRMKKDEAFQGWIKYQRGMMFEDFLAKKLEGFGFTVQKKPKVIIKGKRYEEDLKADIDSTSVYINAKCGTGYVNYVANDYKTTHLIRTRLKRGAWVVYYDYESGVYSVHNPADSNINVGAEITRNLDIFNSAKFAEIAKSAQPLTARKVIQHPSLFSALLNNIITLP